MGRLKAKVNFESMKNTGIIKRIIAVFTAFLMIFNIGGNSLFGLYAYGADENNCTVKFSVKMPDVMVTDNNGTLKFSDSSFELDKKVFSGNDVTIGTEVKSGNVVDVTLKVDKNSLAKFKTETGTLSTTASYTNGVDFKCYKMNGAVVDIKDEKEVKDADTDTMVLNCENTVDLSGCTNVKEYKKISVSITDKETGESIKEFKNSRVTLNDGSGNTINIDGSQFKLTSGNVFTALVEYKQGYDKVSVVKAGGYDLYEDFESGMGNTADYKFTGLTADIKLTRKKLTSYNVNVKNANLSQKPPVSGATVEIAASYAPDTVLFSNTTDDNGKAAFDGVLSKGITYVVKIKDSDGLLEEKTAGTGAVSDLNNSLEVELNADLKDNKILMPTTVTEYRPGVKYTLSMEKASDRYTWSVMQGSKSVGKVINEDNTNYTLIINADADPNKAITIEAKYADTDSVFKEEIPVGSFKVYEIKEGEQYSVTDGDSKANEVNGYYTPSSCVKAGEDAKYKFVKTGQSYDEVSFSAYKKGDVIVKPDELSAGTLYMELNSGDEGQVFKSPEIKTDKTAPQISSTVVSGEKGDGTQVTGSDAEEAWCKSKNIAIAVSDGESGIGRVLYLKDAKVTITDGANYNSLNDEQKKAIDSAKTINYANDGTVNLSIRSNADETGNKYSFYIIDALGNISVKDVVIKNIKASTPVIKKSTLTASPLNTNKSDANTFYFGAAQADQTRTVSAEVENITDKTICYISDETDGKEYFDAELKKGSDSKNYLQISLKDNIPEKQYDVTCVVEDETGSKVTCTFKVVISLKTLVLESISVGNDDNAQDYISDGGVFHTNQKGIKIKISGDYLDKADIKCTYEFTPKHSPDESVSSVTRTANVSYDRTKYTIPTDMEGTYKFYIEGTGVTGQKLVSAVAGDTVKYVVTDGKFTSGDIYVDIDKPEITAIKYNEPKNTVDNIAYYKEALKFSFTVRDLYLDTNESYYEVYKNNVSQGKVQFTSDDNYNYNVEEEKSEDGIYYIKIHVVDTAGNVNEMTGDIKQVAIKDPKFVGINYIPYPGTQSVERNGVTYYNGPIRIEFGINDEVPHTAAAYIGENKMDPYVHNKGGDDGDLLGTEYYIECDSYCTPSQFTMVDNNRTGTYMQKDDKVFSIDAEAPTLKSEIRYVSDYDNSEIKPLQTNRQYHIFSQMKLAIVFTATDGYSGLYKMNIQKSDGTEEDVDLNNSQEQEVSYEVNPDYKGDFKFTLYDNAGNSSVYNTENMVVESQQKHSESYAGSITELNQPNANGYYNSDVAIRCQAAETYAGIKKIEYKIGNSISGVFEPEGDQEVYNWSQDFVINARENNQNEVTASFTVTDNTGRTETVSKTYMIDVTAPVIKVSYNNNDAINQKYYNRSRTATILIDDMNFDPDNTQVIVTKNGSAVDTRASFSSDGTLRTSQNGSTYYEYLMTYSFDEDGDYTFTLRTTDKAGNTSDYGQTDSFTIDMTVPVITVDMNGTPTNGSYYSEARTAVVTVREHNFNAADFKFDVTATNENQPVEVSPISAFTQNGDVYTATVQFNRDAVVTMSASYTDLAGNAAEGIKQQQFTIDLTDPEISIENLTADRTYGKDDKVTPKFTITDTNLDSSSVTIQLIGKKSGVIDAVYSADQIANGYVYSFPDVVEDDVYTLKAYAKDLAGRSKSIDTNFKINRNGSVFTLGNAAKMLNSNKYVKSVGEDLIITETNVSPITSETISYSHGGTIVGLDGDKDYKVSSNINNFGWNENTYDIDHSLFEEEGDYKLSISTTDEVGNSSEIASKQADVEFIVDNTAPTCVVTGVEDNASYKEDSVDVTIEVYDNIAVDTIDVTLNGNVTNYTEKDLVDGKLNINIPSSSAQQTLAVKCTDYAGNTTNVGKNKFTVSTNAVAVAANEVASKPIFWIILGVCVVGIAAGVTGAVVYRKRKNKMNN